MKLFVGVLICAAVIGGFAGGEIADMPFSVVGAIIGGVGTAVVLLGLGAYFDAQERKDPEISPEMRAVFDRMVTGKANPTRKEVEDAKRAYRGSPPSLPNKKQGSVHLKNEVGTEKSTVGKEVAITVEALKGLRDKYHSEGVYTSLAVTEVFKQAERIIKADKEDVIEGITNNKRDPREIALTALWNVANQEVSMGNNHIYRGVLSDKGKGYLYVYNKTVDVLLAQGFISEQEAKADRNSIQANIKAAG